MLSGCLLFPTESLGQWRMGLALPGESRSSWMQGDVMIIVRLMTWSTATCELPWRLPFSWGQDTWRVCQGVRDSLTASEWGV